MSIAQVVEAEQIASPPVPQRASREGVVERVTQILDAFTDAPGRLLLEDVTRITGLPRSTAFRILRQLVDQGWMEHDTRGYSLGTRLATLAARAGDYEDVRVAASVALNELHLATRAVVHLSVLEGGLVHYLDKVGGAASSTVPSRVGARIPAPDTVSGLALLAHLDPEQVDGLIRATRAAADETELEALHCDLAAVRRRQGVAFLSGDQRRTGITSIAAPVLGPRGPVAAISVAAKGTLPPAATAPLLLQAAWCVSRNLYPEWAAAQQRTRTTRPMAAVRSNAGYQAAGALS